MADKSIILRKVATIIKDTSSKLDAADLDSCLEDALEYYNKRLPFYQTDKGTESTATLEETGDVDGELDNWILSGVKPYVNTDANAKLYVTLSDVAGTRKVEVFKDSAKTSKVAEGTKVGDGSLTLSAQNSSGISGTVDVTYNDGETAVVLTWGPTDTYKLPADWDDEFSELITVESPIDNNPRTYLDIPDGVQTVRTEDGDRLLFYATVSEAFRITFTRRVKDLEHLTDIPSSYVPAFCYLTAHFCAHVLSYFYANTVEPSMEAVVVDYKDKSTIYRDLAAESLARFESFVAALDKPASAEKDIDVNFAWGESKIFHRRLNR